MHLTLNSPVQSGGRFFTRSNVRGYCFGFNGQMKDDELHGEGNAYAFEYRIHDARIGRFFSVDPLAFDYPYNSPYAFAQNCVISGGDLEGREHEVKIKYGNEVKFMKSLIKTGDGLKILAGFQKLVQAANSYQKQTGKSTIVYQHDPMNKVALTVYDNKGDVLFMLTPRDASDNGPGGWTLTTNGSSAGSWARPGDPSGSINIDGMFIGGGAAPELKGPLGVIKWVWDIISAAYDVGDKIGTPLEGPIPQPDPSDPVPSTTFPDSIDKAQQPDGSWVTYDQKTQEVLDTFRVDPDIPGLQSGKSSLQVKDELNKGKK